MWFGSKRFLGKIFIFFFQHIDSAIGALVARVNAYTWCGGPVNVVWRGLKHMVWGAPVNVVWRGLKHTLGRQLSPILHGSLAASCEHIMTPFHCKWRVHTYIIGSRGVSVRTPMHCIHSTMGHIYR